MIMQIINKFFTTPEAFKAYVDNINIDGWLHNANSKDRLIFPVVHNTSSPTQALYRSWHDRKGWTQEQWGKNLASYYAGMGWNGCPHLFVCYDGILVLNPLHIRGTHTPSWNRCSWGIETTAEFDTEPFSGGVKDNLIAAVAILCAKAGFSPADFELGKSGIHFHKEDKGTTHKSCPGKNLVKADFVADVVEYMNDKLGFKLTPSIPFDNNHPHISDASQTADTVGMSIEELTSAKWVQVQLNRVKPILNLFYPTLVTDGIIGKNTKAAVTEFQRAKMLSTDGIAGPITRKALKETK